jgi:hypothetical protein
VSPLAASEPRDRCRFGGDFDRATVDCPAFQRAQFIASTSYGKPLGTHVACAHLMVGELSTNQFYPRCSLGSDLERMRWLTTMGPGLGEWQHSSRLDLPGTDEQSILRPEGMGARARGTSHSVMPDTARRR